MSDTSKVEQAANLTPDQTHGIGGGGCTPAEYLTIVDGLTNAYESLISFTVHVFERVSQ